MYSGEAPGHGFYIFGAGLFVVIGVFLGVLLSRATAVTGRVVTVALYHGVGSRVVRGARGAVVAPEAQLGAGGVAGR